MYRLLIVDDAKYMLDMLNEMLDPAKYEVVGTAVDGFEAVWKYKELKPDLITMDLVMGGRDGVSAIRGPRMTRINESHECPAYADVRSPYDLKRIRRILHRKTSPTRRDF